MIKKIAIYLCALTLLGLVGSEGVAFAAKYRSTAQLHGHSGLKAKVEFESKNKSGKAYKRLVVKTSHGVPLKNYSVYVNGKKVGHLSSNMAGKGKLDLRCGYKQSSNSKKMPKWFGKLKKGDFIEVGSSCGIVYDCGKDTVQKYKLNGEAFGEAGEQVNISYCEKFVEAELDRRFTVEISNGPADSSYDVFCDGVFLGTIFVDGSGFGKLELRTASFIPDGSSAQPMPEDFPTLVDGSQCSVGDISVLLSLVTGCNYTPGDDDSSDDGSSDDGSSDDGSSDDGSGDHGSDDDGSDDDSDGNSGPGGGNYD